MSLTTGQLAQIRKILDQRESLLNSDLRRELDNREEYRQLAGEVPDPGDAAMADLVVDLNNVEVGRDLAELRQIAAAKVRVEDGSYGTCVGCGADIPFERLHVQPTATRCTACQSIYEKTYMQDASRSSL